MAVKQLADGRWQADVTLAGGKRARRIFNKRAEAVAFEASHEKQKYEAKLVRVGLQVERYSMEQAIRDFEMSKHALRPSSLKRYGAVLRQLLAFCSACGITYVHQFSPDHATWLYNELIREKPDPKGSTSRLMTPRPKTVNMFLSVIRAVFAHEVAKGHILRSPFLHIKNLPKRREPPDYYKRDELQRFFAQTMHPAYRTAFLGLLHTGLRFAELANMRWSDVDLASGYIHVRAHGSFQPKTHNSLRAIPINATLRSLLSSPNATRVPGDFVFCSPYGRQMRERSLLHVCKVIARRAGISTHAHLHRFRHTFASHLVQQKVPLESIKQLLGHSSITQTEIYAHNESEGLLPDVLSLDTLFN